MPSTYQQPLFTHAADPIKNTLTEVLNPPAAKKDSQESKSDKKRATGTPAYATPIGSTPFDEKGTFATNCNLTNCTILVMDHT
jgi:hypothetical protein